jgi:hypothetical protein
MTGKQFGKFIRPIRLIKFISFIKLWVQIFLSLALCYAEIILLNKLKSNTVFSPELILAICTIAITLMLILNVDSLRSLSIGGLKADLEVIRDEIDERKKELYDLISLSMGKATYENLKKFNREEGFKDYEMKEGEGLYTELYHLRNIGYLDFIKNDGSPKSIKDIPSKGADLSKYIKITDAGLKYIELRENVDS